jgi:hypothetical protein
MPVESFEDPLEGMGSRVPVGIPIIEGPQGGIYRVERT